VADLIYAKLRGALGSVRESVVERRGFDPKTSGRAFFVGISHPLGPMIAVRLRERLARVAPRVEVAFSTRSRPIELERAMREGRIDAAVDWLMPGRARNEVTLFEDALVAVARSGHPALRRTRSINELKKGAFVSLRPRVEGEHPVPGIREWRRLELNYVLEVSELLEVFMVAGQSDLFGLIPRSMMKFGHDASLGQAVAGRAEEAPVPIRLVWSRRARTRPAFLRKLITASSDVVPRGSRSRRRPPA
jgi:DNA-binding transcriptional LysR family regulator